MPERKFSEYIKARKALEDKLAKAGISEDEYIGLFDLLETVTGTDLDTIREDQFYDDARDLAVDIQAATDKKTRQISAYLRRFAEHIVRHACHVEESGKIADIVDRLPQMVDEGDEGEE